MQFQELINLQQYTPEVYLMNLAGEGLSKTQKSFDKVTHNGGTVEGSLFDMHDTVNKKNGFMIYANTGKNQVNINKATAEAGSQNIFLGGLNLMNLAGEGLSKTHKSFDKVTHNGGTVEGSLFDMHDTVNKKNGFMIYANTGKNQVNINKATAEAGSQNIFLGGKGLINLDELMYY